MHDSIRHHILNGRHNSTEIAMILQKPLMYPSLAGASKEMEAWIEHQNANALQQYEASKKALIANGATDVSSETGDIVFPSI
jgi:hypothetical protein